MVGYQICAGDFDYNWPGDSFFIRSLQSIDRSDQPDSLAPRTLVTRLIFQSEEIKSNQSELAWPGLYKAAHYWWWQRFEGLDIPQFIALADYICPPQENKPTKNVSGKISQKQLEKKLGKTVDQIRLIGWCRQGWFLYRHTLHSETVHLHGVLLLQI